MADSEGDFPTPALRAAFAAGLHPKTTDEMVESSARTMAQRLGRPTLPDVERKKTTSVSLSRDSLAYLALYETPGVSRSEIIEILISLARNDPSALVAALRGEAPHRYLTDAELAAVAKIASDSVSAWAMSNPKATVEEIGVAVHSLYAAAVAAVKLNR